jgi:sulfite exporter TauE/SafE
VAIAGAINTNSFYDGIFFMILFGLGTLPVMLAIPLLGNMIGQKVRKKFSGVLNVFIVILGILFILRGLSLGIPYISPPNKMLKPHEKMMMHGGDKQMMKHDSTYKLK